jgi:hypothetical protein
MAALKKLLLALTIVLLVAGLLISTGLINVGNETGWFVVLPAGAIFLGLFLIVRVFEKDTVQFDAEHHARLEKISRSRGTGASSAPSAPDAVPTIPTKGSGPPDATQPGKSDK